ncbi:MAG: choice-of-anchor tandem repeat GloVer-containing protein, partial [Candidatus Dormibacteraceae bacterium]
MSTRLYFSTLATIALMSVFTVAQAPEKVLYSFGASANDGASPNGGLVFDKAGNLYGTTESGGLTGCSGHCGTVFELSPANKGTWTETVLYQFCSQPNCSDGGEPRAGLLIDDLGNLYGTAAQGGIGCGVVGCGTVFELSPPALPGDSWQYTVLWSFGNVANDGIGPYGRLNRDSKGNLYGTTAGSCCVGGGDGIVFELSPGLGGTWDETVLYAFCLSGYPCPDGYTPRAGVSFDAIGNLYGTTYGGANDGKWGTVYRLTPQGDGTWAETNLHRFTGQGGGMPLSTVNFDQSGNLYGTVSTGQPGGPAQCGGVWRLTPQGNG